MLQAEMLALRDVGVSVVQIDEPHLCVLVDPDIRKTFDDPQYEMDLAAAKINEVIEGVDGIRVALHLCRRNWGRKGWGAEGGYAPIIETMKSIKVDQYVMEFSIPAAGDVAILTELPEDALIGLGSVECRFEEIDTPEQIVARVEEALKYVAPERLSLNPRLRLRARHRGGDTARRGLSQAQERGRGRPPPAGQVRLTETVSGAVRSARQQGFLDHAVSGLGSRRSSSKRTRAAPPPPEAVGRPD